MQIDERELAREQFPWRLTEDAGAIARATVGTARAAMHHGGRRLERQRHDVVRRGPAEVREKADTACVVLLERVRLGCERDWCAGVVRDNPTSLMEESDGLRL
ncbi:MAG: hypothetical protein NVS2B3_08140 [Vulcanimicrobiaceae bacterium]